MILVAGALLATALGASLLAGRLRIPGLVAFVGIGMAVGSDGFGWIAFDDYELARKIGIVALALILFEGGLAVGIDELRPVLWPALSLALVVNGVAVIDRVRTRRDVPGALVALADGRFAYTGPIKAIGSARQLQDAARTRLLRAPSDVERAWWREVIGALEGERGTQG